MNDKPSHSADPNARGRLLDGFDKPTRANWQNAVQKTLRGASIEEKLQTPTYEGIPRKPMYDADDLNGLRRRGGYPGNAGVVRGSGAVDTGTQPWLICAEILGTVPARINTRLKSELAGGADAIRLAMQVATTRELDAALTGVSSETVPIYLDAGPSGLSTLSMLVAVVENKGIDLNPLRGAVEMDPLHALSRDGLLSTSLSRAYDEMAHCTRFAVQSAPHLKTIRVSTQAAHDAGGNAVQELAIALATGVAYIRALCDRKLDIDQVAAHMAFSFSVRGDFFMEVAKLRAARLLWSRVVAEFGGTEESRKMEQHVRTSKWNKSALLPHVNMLRATTETLSAVVGGADAIHTAGFDAPVRTPDDFSNRIARNVQHILRAESRVGNVADPAGGAYYVEVLTDKLSRAAWKAFQEIEQQGGMEDALKKGLLQQQLEEVAARRFRDFATRKSVLVGTNQYVDIDEKPIGQSDPTPDALRQERDAAMRAQITDPSRRERVAPLIAQLKEISGTIDAEVVRSAVEAARAGAFVGEIRGAFYGGAKWGGIEIEPFETHRVSARYEHMREAVRAHTHRVGEAPKVFLANLGSLAEYKARADFAREFLEVGGFQIIGANGFETPEAAAQAAVDSSAKLCVICSADPNYPKWVPVFMKEVQQAAPSMQVLLAGYPAKQVEAHKKSGVDGFIHLGADHFGMLTTLLNQGGVAL